MTEGELIEMEAHFRKLEEAIERVDHYMAARQNDYA